MTEVVLEAQKAGFCRETEQPECSCLVCNGGLEARPLPDDSPQEWQLIRDKKVLNQRASPTGRRQAEDTLRPGTRSADFALKERVFSVVLLAHHTN